LEDFEKHSGVFALIYEAAILVAKNKDLQRFCGAKYKDL